MKINNTIGYEPDVSDYIKATNIIAGENISITTEGNNVTINATGSVISDYTLTASSWESNSQTLSITGKTADNDARVSNSNTGTDSEVLSNANAISAAYIYKITDNGTSLTFVCETTPTVDLIIQVEVY